jgi:hypothetical protein
MSSKNISDKAKEILKAICIRKAVLAEDYDQNILHELLSANLVARTGDLLRPTQNGVDFVKQEYSRINNDTINTISHPHNFHIRTAIPEDMESFIKEMLDGALHTKEVIVVEKELTKSESKVLHQLYNAVESVPPSECMPRILSQLTKRGYISEVDDKVTLSVKGVAWILFGITQRVKIYRTDDNKIDPDWFLWTPINIINGLL